MASLTSNLAWQELALNEQRSHIAGLKSLPVVASSCKTASRKQKAVAACTGAVVTSLLSELFLQLRGQGALTRLAHSSSLFNLPPPLDRHSTAVTPFDVIKTRLQTQSSAEPLFVPSGHIYTSPRISEASSSKFKLSPLTQSHSATCCRQTFFIGNSYENGLTCRYDPRLAAESGGSASAAVSASRGSLHTISSPSAARSRSQHPRAPLTHSTAFVHPPSVGPSAAMRQHPSSTCAYPSQSVAAIELDALTRRSRVTGIWDGMVKLSRTEGAKGLWRGLSPTLSVSAAV